MSLFSREYTVVIDTQVFDAVRFDFSNPNLRYLVKLAKSGRVHLLLTPVIVEEVKTHIARESKRAVDQLRASVRHPLVRQIESNLADALNGDSYGERLQNASIARFEDFLKSTSAEIATISGVSIDHVMRDYFAGRPPFGTREKKAEFPDAFSLHAVHKWAEDKMYPVVYLSGDGDVKAFCDHYPRLTYHADLAHFLALFPDPQVADAAMDWLDKHWDDVEELLGFQVSNWNFDLKNADGDVHEAKLASVSQVLEAEVVEADATTVHIAADIEIEVKADIEAVTPFHYDPYDPRYWGPPTRGSIRDTFEIGIDIAVSLDPKSKAPIELDSVEVTDRPSWLRIKVPADWEP